MVGLETVSYTHLVGAAIRSAGSVRLDDCDRRLVDCAAQRADLQRSRISFLRVGDGMGLARGPDRRCRFGRLHPARSMGLSE